MNKNLKAAHFLLVPELLYSPPNSAIVTAYLEQGYSVDIFAPGLRSENTNYGSNVRLFSVTYTWVWILKNLVNRRWLRYDCFSGTSEDPLAIVGLLGWLYRKKTFALVDEIKSGSYRGDRSEIWKRMCIKGIKSSCFQIVNDSSRISLLSNYAGLRSGTNVIVYPGCFLSRPIVNKKIQEETRKKWGIGMDKFVIGSSGGFNMTAGAEWLIHSLSEIEYLYAVIQPLGVSDLSLFLLGQLPYHKRTYVEHTRLNWQEAWISAASLDIGLCIYSNPAPQFQNMGISSNRLCMFIAMGVPVIASRQESFKFIEHYGCGVLVEDYNQFIKAIEHIKINHTLMKQNCEQCFVEYINPAKCYESLSSSIRNIRQH